MHRHAVKAQVDEVFPLMPDGNNDRAGIDPDPDFEKYSELAPNVTGPSKRCFKHVERGVAGSDCVIFKSNGRPEARHDPIALFSADPSIVANNVVHGVDGRFQNPASVLRIAIVNQRRRTRDVGEKNGYILPFAILRAADPPYKMLRCLDLRGTVGRLPLHAGLAASIWLSS
jgi:hypothetical protein